MRRLVSWNVLADAYVRAEFYPRTDPAILRAGARTPAMLEALAADPAELFCLQEVEVAVIDAIRAAFPSWSVHFERKRGKPEGCAILARPGIDVTEVRGLAFEDGAPDREDSGHVALLATIRMGGRQVRIANTHLRWDPPGTAPDQRWGVREVRELLANLVAPAIVCGDLNVEPSDTVYRMLIEAGFVDAHALDARPTCNPNGRAKRIDFILGTADLRATATAPAVVVDDTPLPSATMPSDHVPIAAAFD